MSEKRQISAAVLNLELESEFPISVEMTFGDDASAEWDAACEWCVAAWGDDAVVDEEPTSDYFVYYPDRQWSSDGVSFYFRSEVQATQFKLFWC